jgi:hypothetical protein
MNHHDDTGVLQLVQRTTMRVTSTVQTIAQRIRSLTHR